MTPEPTKSDTSGQGPTLPPEIIAQAEAAVAGNTPKGQRRPSRQQNDLFKTLSGGNHGLASALHILSVIC